MMDKSLLPNLNLVELQIFLEHIRLGPDHVTKLLNKKQFSEVLELGYITQEQLREVGTNKIEKIGNVALVLNTIITSSFGAWMGLSSCMGLTLGSPVIFATVTTMTCLLSVAIGYNSYQMIKEQAAGAIKRQKFANLELKILSRIQIEWQKKIMKLEAKLYSAVEGEIITEKKAPANSLKSEEEVEAWLKQLKTIMDHRLQDVANYRLHRLMRREWSIDFKKITKILKTHLEFINQLSTEPGKEEEQFLKKRKNISGVELLIDPTLNVPKTDPRVPSWLEKNGKALLVSLAPTLLGGFASMFVFIGGIPNIVKAFGCESCYAFLTHFYAGLIEVGFAILITLYLGFAHLYSARKAAQRRGYLTKTKQAITNQETAILAKNSHVKMLYKVRYILTRMFSRYQILPFETQLENETLSQDLKKSYATFHTANQNPLFSQLPKEKIKIPN